MGAVALDLKIRKTNVPDIEKWRRTVRDIVHRDEIDFEQRVDWLLRTVVQIPLEAVHDKRWLETIVNYVPRKDDGTPIPQTLTKQAEWLRLAQRVNNLDDTREGTFQLSTTDVERIWRRLTDEKFTHTNFPLSFQEFILEFCEKAGKRFAGDVDDEEELK